MIAKFWRRSRKVRRLPHRSPAAPAVRATLEKLLASETFARSERARELLRYLVEQELSGRADRLKGFAIAVDVFGRDADFDSASDAVVRVQAGRLRELLAQYFATEGVAEPIRITVPRGSYVPAYEIVGDLVAAPAPQSQPEQEAASQPQEPEEHPPAPEAADVSATAMPLATEARVMQHLRFFWAAMVLVIAMLGFVIFRILTPVPVNDPVVQPSEISSSSTSSITLPAAMEALPPVYIKTRSTSPDVARIAAVLRTGLTGFDTVDLIAREPAGGIDANAPVDPLQFVFDVAPGPTGGSVVINLTNSATGKVLVSRVLNPADLDAEALDDRIADLLSATIPVSGTIYGFIERNGLGTGLVKCLILNDRYYLDPAASKQEMAYRCFADLAERGGKSPLIYGELASLHLKAITDRLPYPPQPSAEQALALAHRAVLMGPTSPYAHRAYGFLNSRVGDMTESIRFMRKAYELNTYDLSMAAAYGYSLIFAGDYKTGEPIMERAVEASSAHPNWWDYALFLAAFMIGDDARAARATEALTSTKKAHYYAARLIAANNSGNTVQARALIDEIMREYPAFAANPREAYENANYPADMVSRLETALRAAGLMSPS